MCRYSHDGAGAVAHQNIIGNENRNLGVVYRIDGANAFQLHTGLFLDQLGALEIRLACCFLTVCANRINVAQLVRPLLNHRMLRRDNHVGCAEQRVRTGSIYRQRIAFRCLEIYFRARRTADPVFLLGLDALDIVNIVQIINQTLCVFGNLEHPLALILADNLAAAALANAVDNFFIRQYTLTAGAPVDCHFLLVCQSLLEQLQENPLCPLVVARVRGVDFTVPVKGQTQCLELALKACNIALGDLSRMYVVLDGKVLGRQTECIPAHRVQNVVALHAALSCDDIQCGVGTRMAYVQTCAGRIRKFNQRIKLRLGIIRCCSKSLLIVPGFLPLCFNGFKIVFFQCYGSHLTI